MFHLSIKRPGSLLSVLVDRDISDVQFQAITEILENDRMAFNVVEHARISRLFKETYPEWAGLAQFLEQFQAEDR